MVDSITVAMAEVRLRFGWLWEAPYVFAEACTVEGATLLLDQLPISEHPESVRIRTHLLADLKEVKHGMAPSPTLNNEVSSYMQFQLSSIRSEGYHRNLAMRGSLGNNQTLASLFATSRFNQNFDIIREWLGKEGDVVAYFWGRVNNAVSLGDNPQRLPRNFSRPKKMRPSELTEQFYRLETRSVPEDTTAEVPQDSGAAQSELRGLVRCKEQFANWVMESGTMLTFKPSEEEEDQGRFSVISVLKLFTSSSQAVLPGSPNLNGQVSVQEYDVWQVEGGDAYPPIALDVMPKGEPRNVEVFSLIQDFQAFKNTYRVWDKAESAVLGCVRLEGAHTRAADLSDETVPVIMFVQALWRTGWESIYKKVVHSNDGRLFSMVDVSARRPYLQVLLHWDETPINDLPSDMPLDFYRCVLAGLDPPLGKTAAFYKQLLKGDAVDRGGDVLARGAFVQPEGERYGAVAVADPGEAFGCIAGHESDSSSTSGTSSRSSAQPIGFVEDDEDAWPTEIEGGKVHVEDRIADNEPGRRHSYKRLIVTCCIHPDCRKRRNTGPRQRRELGWAEPVAFLGAWMANGRRFRTAQSHKGSKPTMDEQRAWHASHR